MRTVSFQGIQLTAGQRRQHAFQQQAKASFLSASLQQILDDSAAELAKRKEQGAKPERIWFVDRIEKGTPWLGDVFGY
ncbi:hypothetical protein [Phytopseudomonas daroniae]|uniref:hypothetical protein n=1 Tax=Phytopseudomonas daroniae TaxID=2487519 RepID=UPI0010383C28|nr:hypothetical protein [Pseudomonas daroniae]TBU73713.1 hypothetical protein DNK10_17770 [Pseudomonas daroniae]